MGVQACHLPGLKRLPLKPFKPCKLCKRCSERRTVQAIALPQGHIAYLDSAKVPRNVSGMLRATAEQPISQDEPPPSPFKQRRRVR